MTSLPDELREAAVHVGQERVHSVDGVHGACDSWALPVDAAAARAALERALGAPSTGTGGWRHESRGASGRSVQSVEVHEGGHAPVPGFRPELVPSTTRCVVVVTTMTGPPTTERARRRLFGRSR